MSTADLARDRAHLIHPLHRPAAQHHAHEWVSGHGSVLVDQAGREFFDGLAGLWNVVVGHGRQELAEAAAKLVIYRAFIEAELDIPHHLDRKVHDMYFNPTHEEFQARTMWSLSNAFTSAFKELEPVPQFKATAKLAEFLKHVT